MFDVAKSSASSKRAICRVASKVALLICTASLAGCMSSVTSTVQASKSVSEYAIASIEKLDLSDEVLADALSIQRAVTAADQTQIAGLSTAQPVETIDTAENISAPALPWENLATGSTGDISLISETRKGSKICRTFKTSRLNFDGVSLYEGRSCQSGNGGWTLRRFNQVS